VVHIFSASYFSFVLAPTPALLVSYLFRRPTILNYHSGEARDHLTRWRRTALPTLRLADRLVVQSGYLVEVFAEFGLEAEAVSNSLDLDHFPFRLRDPIRPVFLCNRNFEKHYGVETVLEAFSLVQEEIPESELLLAGAGSQLTQLRSLAAELGCSKVSFLGPVPPEEMPDLYGKADIFLNGSRLDNMPLSIMEAQACGLPVVTSDAGGIPWMVKNGQTALVASVDDPASLASQALRLVREPDLARGLSREGRALVEREYTMERILPLWVELYTDMASGKGS
jgi:glycosyltransferase involved in cell wall biosynthesis